MVSPKSHKAFLFENIWPFLRLAQISGTFPYQKDLQENGEILLKRENRIISALKYAFLFLLLISLYIGIFMYAFWNKEIPDWDLMMSQMSTTASSYLVGVQMPIWLGSAMLSQWKNFTFDLEESFSSMKNLNNKPRRSSKLCLMTWAIIFLVPNWLTLVAMFTLYDELGFIETFWDTVLIGGIFLLGVLLFLVNFSAEMPILAIHSELTVRIIDRISELKNHWQCNIERFPEQWIRDVLDLLKTIQKISTLLAFHYLLFIIKYVISLVGSIYIGFDYLTSSEAIFSMKIMFGVQTLLTMFGSIMILVTLNFPSDKIKAQLQDLKKTVSVFESVQGIKVNIDGKFLEEAYVRSMVVDSLDDFEGFDLGGYSNLGKPLLGSIVTNTLTYLIVLLQFKVSEN